MALWPWIGQTAQASASQSVQLGRPSVDRHFSNFVSQPTSVLGDIMGILKKKYSWQNVSWEMPYQD